jgi:peptidoglycan/LPS O-acetylase OafA/YrhL
MRGLAAMVVVLHHFGLMWIYHDTHPMNAGALAAYPLFAGHESVVLFFLLSGFVLSLPYVKGSGQAYPVFLLRRVLRIYCPYLFGLALAVAGNAIWHGALGRGNWADWTWAGPVTWRHVMQQVGMLGDYNWLQFNTAFWSLVVEMRLSIVFPALFWMVRRMKAPGTLVMGDGRGQAWMDWASTLENGAVFLCGILMAMHLAQLGVWCRSLGRWGRAGLAVGAFVLFEYTHVLGSLRGTWRLKLWHVQDWGVAAGAAGLMLVGLESAVARRFLGGAAPQFLGRISYSLYLVHGTVLFAVTYGLAGRVSALGAFAVYLAGTMVLSVGLCVWVEEPFVRLGRRVGAKG